MTLIQEGLPLQLSLILSANHGGQF